jgi:hypothetical protein
MDHAGSRTTTALVDTRRQLHGIAECLFAGPEYQATGEIALRVTPGGFGTTTGAKLRLDGLELIAGSGGCQRQGRSAILLTGLVSSSERRRSAIATVVAHSRMML